MQFINYFFTSIISFLGLLIGIVLTKIAPEEQKPLRKYFVLARRIILILIFIFVLFYYFNSKIHMLTLIAYLVFLLFTEYKIKDILKISIFNYAVLGIIFFVSSINLNLFVIESSLILLYGIPTASLIYQKKQKNHSKLLFYNLVFVIIANLLFFL